MICSTKIPNHIINNNLTTTFCKLLQILSYAKDALLFVFRPYLSMEDEGDAVLEQEGPLIPEHAKQATKALLLLLLYSSMMFTLPFLAFFGTKYLLQDVFGVTGFVNTAWSVLMSVITVNLVIVGYVYHAFHEKEYNDEGEEIIEDENAMDSKKED